MSEFRNFGERVYSLLSYDTPITTREIIEAMPDHKFSSHDIARNHVNKALESYRSYGYVKSETVTRKINNRLCHVNSWIKVRE